MKFTENDISRLKKGFSRHDIIEVENGLIIFSEVPEYFFFSNSCFSNNKKEHKLEIGEVLKFPTPADSLEEIKKTLKNDLVISLEKFGLIAQNYEKNIQDYITSLNLKFDEKTLDTSIYEGKYIVYYVGRDKDDVWVYCEKLDNSGIEIRFRQSEASKPRGELHVKILTQ